jgi:hypothetical protein
MGEGYNFPAFTTMSIKQPMVALPMSALTPKADIDRRRSFAGLLRGYSLLLHMGFTVVHSGTLECAQGRIFDRSRNPF